MLCVVLNESLHAARLSTPPVQTHVCAKLRDLILFRVEVSW